MEARRKRLVIFLACACFFLPSLGIYAKVPLRVSILTYPTRPRLGEDFQVIVRVNQSVAFAHRVYYSKENFPEALSMVGGPYVKPISDGSTDYIYVLKANEIGLFILPPFSYTDGDTNVKTTSTPLEILPRDHNSENYKLKGAYRSPPLSVYQGQAFSLVLEAQNLTDLMPVGTQNLPPVANAIIENAPGFGSIVEHIFQNRTLYNLPVMAWIVASNEASSLTLPSIMMKVGNQSVTSPSVTINVLPLPPEVKDSAAVGNFRLRSEISETSIIEDSVLQLKLRLEGEGNFHILKMPELEMSNNFEVLEQEEVRVLLPSTNGYTGYIEQIYQLKPTTAGSPSFISVPDFVFWDPQSLLVEKTGAKNYPIEVFSGMQNTRHFSFFSTDAIMLKKDFSVFNIFLLWIILLPLFVWKILIMSFRPKEKPVSFFIVLPLVIFPLIPWQQIPETLRLADQYIQEENWPAAQQEFAKSIALLPQHKAVLMYNQAIAMQRQDKVGWTSYYLMKAIQYDPFEAIYREAWNLHQKQFKLSSSIVLHNFSYTFYVYYLLFIFTFISILVATIAKRYPYVQKGSFILSIFLIVSFLAIFCYQISSKKSWAVTLEDTSLGRIPEKDVSTLYIIREGTILDIVARFDNFYLLTNQREGIEGWAKADQFALGQDNTP